MYSCRNLYPRNKRGPGRKSMFEKFDSCSNLSRHRDTRELKVILDVNNNLRIRYDSNSATLLVDFSVFLFL